MMDKKEKGRQGENPATKNVQNDSSNSTTANGARLREVDPLVGWYSLGANVKPSRERQQKRGWNRSAK